MQKIELESTFTPWTLDMYQTFTFEKSEDYLLEDNGGEYDDYDWNYNCIGYLQALAKNRLTLLKDNILDDVILDISANGEPISPNQYNYTTDKAFNFWHVNVDELENFVTENADDFLLKNKIKNTDGFMWLGDDLTTKLHYYLRKVSAEKYTPENYYYDQVDQINEINYITIKKII